ncbi:Permease of the drug/metabolite transporter (DMT) superfamily [Cohnella sp. OV330]|uniref:DMT family transporter n=1 Tax=Cohnella sp. OV330 TaxID=1855288 RepID=UPI0008F43C3B|nr:EamA family transporter [Cohnella sp. OV330]SFB46987.1 Permease of the drug/metabolite transporter (DMT) superfamily [Cohnella sp. OV330]
MNPRAYASLILVTTLTMGLAFPVGRIGLDYAPPFLLMGIRFVAAGLIMAAFAARRLKPKGISSWLRIALIGTLNSAGVMGCSYYSMRWITSGESAILIFVNPLLVILFGALFMKARYRVLQWAGVALGFAGVFCTMGAHLSMNPGTLISLLGACCFTAASLLIKRWGQEIDTWVLTGYQMLFGGIVLGLLSALFEHPHIELGGGFYFSLVWLVLVNSILQFSGWSYLLQRGDPAKTNAFLFLAPFFGVIGGAVLLGEPLHAYVAAGGAMICAGIFLVNWRGAAPRRVATAERA